MEVLRFTVSSATAPLRPPFALTLKSSPASSGKGRIGRRFVLQQTTRTCDKSHRDTRAHGLRECHAPLPILPDPTHGSAFSVVTEK